jgi:hypothetical protein
MPVTTAIFWLKSASAVLMIGFGLMFALATHPATAGLATLFLDALIWPLDGAQSFGGQETRIVTAIGGGITVGWGVLIWMVAGHILPENPALGRSILQRSLLAWFVVDSTASILAGVPQNAAANVLFLLAFLYPLWRMKRQDFAAPQLQ